MSMKPQNENNNNIVLKNLNYKEINKKQNMANKKVHNKNINHKGVEKIPNKKVHNKNINHKGVEKISNKKEMGGKNIICKDIKSNLLLNPSEINDNQKAQEIKKKVVKDLMKNENKEIFKQIETINSVGTMAKIKNSLYNMIFRGVNFWKGLAIYLGALSGGAIGQMILSFIFQFTTLYTFSYAATFTALPTLIAFGSFLGIILLTIITVFCLLVWLWPSKKKLMGNDNRENKNDT
ncbi:hypothetical protein PFUGPA_00125 [Plasmodium falciparum Palo Alto/Uganda]|uniref:Exported protein family 4 n=1 Tax=Plasmodium falciparum (isolate Palo Alto / Uganda) TaxID=57270 RepID=W4J8N0_PLAFP|nr:hypothetical protein PFUGPA_00125 [Plasmodium falciparum Palo Alto/Uganda]